MNEKEKQILETFYELHREVFENRLVKNFLKANDNEQLLLMVLIKPTQNNIEIIDNRFKQFYQKIRIIKYISSLIYFYTIDFDKQVSKINKRFNLTLDDTNTVSQLQNYSSHPTAEEDYLHSNLSFNNILENNELHDVFLQLTEKQQKILNLIYIMGFSNKEVALIFNDSAQNISNIHRRALRTMKRKLIEIKKEDR